MAVSAPPNLDLQQALEPFSTEETRRLRRYVDLAEELRACRFFQQRKQTGRLDSCERMSSRARTRARLDSDSSRSLSGPGGAGVELGFDRARQGGSGREAKHGQRNDGLARRTLLGLDVRRLPTRRPRAI